MYLKISFHAIFLCILYVMRLFQDLEISGPELSDWEKYASEEYEILVSEEGINEQEEM